jgi:inner membrane protein
MMAGLWWVWVSAGVLMAIVEVFIPGFFFLGFSAGAVVTGLVLLAGGPFAAWLGSSVAYTFLFFAVFSLISWLLLRRLAGVREGQLKIWDRDINED